VAAAAAAANFFHKYSARFSRKQLQQKVEILYCSESWTPPPKTEFGSKKSVRGLYINKRPVAERYFFPVYKR